MDVCVCVRVCAFVFVFFLWCGFFIYIYFFSFFFCELRKIKVRFGFVGCVRVWRMWVCVFVRVRLCLSVFKCVFLWCK